ncbi:MAG TPA: hypothetical protein PLS90_17505 [Candidatus Sumerlaeota bacterium]|nr:hypothetical protein [Candidatus Sumerlaeota bacterium]HPK04244.1 hypothetical protein [Candidatus Sumerlaeota bacterium]
MALWDGRPPDAVAPADAVAVVHAFLTRCRRWALEQELPRRHREVDQTWDAAAAARLHAWCAYLEFTEHALRELEAGALDDWFGEAQPEPPAEQR